MTPYLHETISALFPERTDTQLTQPLLVDRGYTENVDSDDNGNVHIDFKKGNVKLRLCDTFSKRERFEVKSTGEEISTLEELIHVEKAHTFVTKEMLLERGYEYDVDNDHREVLMPYYSKGNIRLEYRYYDAYFQDMRTGIDVTMLNELESLEKDYL